MLLISVCALLSGARAASSAPGSVRISSGAELRSALFSGSKFISFDGPVDLDGPLELNASHSGLRLMGAGPAAVLRLPAFFGRSAVSVLSASNVSLSGFGIEYASSSPPAWGLLPAALFVDASSGVSLARLSVRGGVRLGGGDGVRLSWSDVSNVGGAQNGTCVYVPGCGDASTLTPCNLTIENNLVHDCRWDGSSPYAASAQGVMLGAQDGAPGPLLCTVGVIVRNNNLSGIDEMGARVANNAHCSCVLNQIVFNKIEDWGQLPQVDGGDTTDSGCLYQYGHWYSPGNNWSFNYCHSNNRSWGQNGVYLDDAASGSIVTGLWTLMHRCWGAYFCFVGGGASLGAHTHNWRFRRCEHFYHRLSQCHG